MQGALTRGYAEGSGVITRDNLELELERIVGKDYTLSGEKFPLTVQVGEYQVYIFENGKITGVLPKTAGTTPWLPEGFSQVEGTDLSNGLTITNSTGLQNYVWIEVPTTISASVNGTTITLAEAKNDSEILEILEVYAGKGTNKDYTKGSSDRTSDWKDEWYDIKGNTIAADQSNKNDTAGCGMTYSEYQTAYSDMLNSIKTFGGFWLAQYEAGISYEQGNRNSSSSRITNPLSANYAKNQYPYNFVRCSEAQKIANADSTSGYTSSLPFGIQWDLVCKFLEVKGAKTYTEIASKYTWGNYKNTGWTSSTDSRYSDDNGESFKSEIKTKSSGSYLLTTGAIESTTESGDASPMNIYDFAGNVFEWTLENGDAGGSYHCAFRGGDYLNENQLYRPAACRWSYSTTLDNSAHGFRSVLY